MHNDYVTGGLALARATGAAYLVNADDPVAFRPGRRSRDGDVIEVRPALRVTVHRARRGTRTPTCPTCWTRPTASRSAVFSGGSLLYGSTGRPDLLGPGAHRTPWSAHQYASAHRLAAELPDAPQVLPTHGFGSFCSATQSEATASTIGRRSARNPALTQDEEALRRRAAGRPGRLPGLLRADGPGQRRRPAPRRPDAPAAGRRRRAAPPARRRGVGGRPAHPDRVRRRTRRRAR